MPGFGYGPFGSGPFGSFDWAKQVLFRDLPELDRQEDAGVGDGRLELFTDAIKPSFDELLRFARGFGDLRDADRVRTQFQGRIDVNLLRARTSASGRTIEVRVENADPSDPFATLGEASVGWILKDAAGREFTVNSVHKLRELDPFVELAGVNEPPFTAFNQGTQLTGTMAFVSGSTAVVGVGTAFLAEVAIGDYVAPLPDGFVAKIESVTDNENLVLEKSYPGSSVASVNGIVTQAERGAAVLRPPGLMRLLGADFGLAVDTHEPEAFQRSSVHDIVQWLGLKGAQRSYDIIGKIAGYRAEAFGLWRIDPVPDAFPPDEVFELPSGSGKFYTSNFPLRPFFDEIPADTVPADFFCYETPDWTTEGIEPPTPSPPDGTSVEAAIALESQGLGILGTTDLGGGRWEIRVGPGADLANVISTGFWYADFPSIPDRRHYLETLPVEGPPGEWTFEVLAGLTPTFGGTVNVSYECHIAPTCEYCRASVIRVEVVPVEVLSDPDALLDGVLSRLVNKVALVVPIHVRQTELVHILGPVQANMNIIAQGEVSSAVTAAAQVGYYYDIVPADELPIDQDHMIATGMVSTTP